MSRKKILCLTSYYLPGYKSGGPLRSLLHLQEWLGDEYEFAVLTRNRDLGETEPYPELEAGRWHVVRGVRVRYLAAPYWRPAPIRAAIRDFQPDALYFHSSVDFSLTIVPLLLRWLGLLPRSLPVIVAPRGEYSAGARAIKAYRKQVFFLFARIIGLYRNVTWQATKSEEVEQIKALWGADVQVLVAPNLPSRMPARLPHQAAKQPGSLRLVFLARIARMKNLHGALQMLSQVTQPVTLDIYGTKEDPAYWDECSALIDRLPTHIKAEYKSAVSPDEVIPVLSRYDALLLPTLGENFGHVIHEALLAGCPVVISDRTPWRNLTEVQAGFDLSLERPELFRLAIERLAGMDVTEHRRWSDSAQEYGFRYSSNSVLAGQSRAMLDGVVAPRQPCGKTGNDVP